MEQMKMSKGGKFWWVVYPLFLIIGIQIVIGLVSGVVVLIPAITEYFQNAELPPIMTADELLTDNIFFEIVNYASTIICGIITLILGIYLMKRDVRIHGLVRDKSQGGSLLSWIAVILAAAGFCLFGNFLIEYTKIMDYFPFSQWINSLMEDQSPTFMFFSAVFIAPFTEEIITRGLVFKRLRSMMSFLPAAVISGIMFGIMHLNVVQGLYAVMGGVIFAYIYEKKQSLSGTIVAHMAANALALSTEYFLPEFFMTQTGMLIMIIASGIVCVVSILLIKQAFKNSPPWQVKAISQ